MTPFQHPLYRRPGLDARVGAPDVTTAPAPRDRVAPAGYHATSIYPEYVRLDGQWVLLTESRMDCVIVIADGRPIVTEMRRLRRGDAVVLGRAEDGSEGIWLDAEAFQSERGPDERFSFRVGLTRETAASSDYDRLYDLLRHERDHGYVVWVLGPAVVFDADSRRAMQRLVECGYVTALLAGNALATHDIEGALYGTALGQAIYSRRPMPLGHYHHLDAINAVVEAGGLVPFVKARGLRDGVIAACVRQGVPVVLAGSIRDDGPLPDVIADVYEAQDAMRAHTRRATTVLGLATQLHSIATGNMTPSYQVIDGLVRPVYFYAVDVTEFATNKLHDRGSLGVTPFVTNVQDFLVNLARNLCEETSL